MYEVIKAFADGENGVLLKGGYTYAVGDNYPKNGFHATQEHTGYLLDKKYIKAVKPKQEAKKNDEGRE